MSDDRPMDPGLAEDEAYERGLHDGRQEARDRIASLERELAEARDALEPFAKMATDIDESGLGTALHDEGALLALASTWETPIGNPSVGDLRRAARVHASLSTARSEGASGA